MARARFRPSDEQRQKVKALAGYGLSHQDIATVAGVGCVATLRKYFHEELTLGPLEAQSNVMRALFRQASSGRNPAATMFWLKTRAGWSEQGKVCECQLNLAPFSSECWPRGVSVWLEQERNSRSCAARVGEDDTSQVTAVEKTVQYMSTCLETAPGVAYGHA